MSQIFVLKKKTSDDHQTQSDDQNQTIERHDNPMLFRSRSYSFAAIIFLQIPILSPGETSTIIVNKMAISSIERIE